LLTVVLARQAAAAVGVRTCWPWETDATLPSARRRKTLRRPRGRRGAGAYRGGRPPTACFIMCLRCLLALRDIISYSYARYSLFVLKVPLNIKQTIIGLVNLTFDISTSKWGHWSPVSWASFLPIFGLLCLSILELGLGTGQTDGQTDGGHQRYGAEE